MNWTVPGIRWTYNNYWPLFLFMSSVSLYWVLLITVLNPEDTEMHPELGGIYAKMYRQENGVFDTGGICASQSVFRRFRASCCSKTIGLFSDKPPREVRFSGKSLGFGTRRTYSHPLLPTWSFTSVASSLHPFWWLQRAVYFLASSIVLKLSHVLGTCSLLFIYRVSSLSSSHIASLTSFPASLFHV